MSICRIRVIYAAGLVLLLLSCATTPHPLQSDAVVIGNVPFFAQEEYQCGPAALAGVLAFWGIHTAPDMIAREIYSRHAQGTLTMDMILFAQKQGLTAEYGRGNWENLIARIANGYPLIVLVDLGSILHAAHHYMVVVGFSEEGVVVNSGKTQHMFIDKQRFLNSWQKANFWTLWIRPKMAH